MEAVQRGDEKMMSQLLGDQGVAMFKANVRKNNNNENILCQIKRLKELTEKFTEQKHLIIITQIVIILIF